MTDHATPVPVPPRRSHSRRGGRSIERAGPGGDPYTGLGSPKAAAVISSLLAAAKVDSDTSLQAGLRLGDGGLQ
jgi:hypothetical protein